MDVKFPNPLVLLYFFIEAATRKTLLLKSKKRQEPIVLSNEATKN